MVNLKRVHGLRTRRLALRSKKPTRRRAVEPMHALEVHLPSLATKQDMNPSKAVSSRARSQSRGSAPAAVPAPAYALVANARAGHTERPASATLADPIRILPPGTSARLAVGLRIFFRSAS